jgi:hypothetical protein
MLGGGKYLARIAAEHPATESLRRVCRGTTIEFCADEVRSWVDAESLPDRSARRLEQTAIAACRVDDHRGPIPPGETWFEYLADEQVNEYRRRVEGTDLAALAPRPPRCHTPIFHRGATTA